VKPAADPELEAAKAFFRPLVEGKQALRTRSCPPPLAAKRQRKTATFFMMDHDLLSSLGRALNYPALVLLSEIDRRVFTSRKNPIQLPNLALHRLGLDREAKRRGLQRLQKAGAIDLVYRKGQGPLVTWNNPARPRNIP
jgi:hypothetical protein